MHYIYKLLKGFLLDYKMVGNPNDTTQLPSLKYKHITLPQYAYTSYLPKYLICRNMI